MQFHCEYWITIYACAVLTTFTVIPLPIFLKQALSSEHPSSSAIQTLQVNRALAKQGNTFGKPDVADTTIATDDVTFIPPTSNCGMMIWQRARLFINDWFCYG